MARLGLDPERKQAILSEHVVAALSAIQFERSELSSIHKWKTLTYGINL